MSLKFNGGLVKYKEKIETKFENVSYQEKSGYLRFTTKSGTIADYYESTGTIRVAGKDDDKYLFNELFESENNEKYSGASYKTIDNKNVFIVHGHDEGSKDELELILRRWGLEPIIIHQQPNKGKTLIESIEENVKKCQYAIVLLTPDDMGYSEKDGKEHVKPRARQNVILEMGLVIGWLGRDKVAILRKTVTEEPSDISGVLYIAYDKSIKDVSDEIKKELKSVGIEIKD